MGNTEEAILAEYETLVDPNAATPAPEVDPVTPDPEPVNYDAQFAEIKATYDEREKGYQRQLADTTSKLEKLERLVQGGFSQAHPAPVKDEEFDTSFTKEDLVKDAVGTIERVSANRSRKDIKALTDQLNPVVQNLVERGYQSELALVKQKKYYDKVKDKLDKTFVDQPQLKGQAGAVDYAYKMLVGEYMEDHDPVTPPPPGDPPTETPVETPAAPVQNRTPVSGKPGGGAPPTPAPAKEKVELSAEQQRVKAKFAGIYKEMGLEVDDGDFGGAA